MRCQLLAQSAAGKQLSSYNRRLVKPSLQFGNALTWMVVLEVGEEAVHHGNGAAFNCPMDSDALLDEVLRTPR